MGVRASVFGSRSEERGFRSIQHKWGDRYNLYPQLPFSAIFEPDHTIHDTSNLFYKTSIDYTLCTKGNTALLAIDFDGMGHGFDRNGNYVPVKKTSDPYRKDKFDFKLRYAKRNGLPYHIISYEELDPIGEATNLAIMDGIIGFQIARRDFDAKIVERVSCEQDIIDALSPDERYEYIQTLVTDQEVLSEIEHDPIVKRAMQLHSELGKLGCKVPRWGYSYVEEPELPDLEYDPPASMLPTLESFKARCAAMGGVMRIGCIYSLKTSLGEVSEIAWMRNVGNLSQTFVIVQNIAELLVYAKALRLANKSRQLK